MARLTAFLAGLLFGVGLLLSGMANPAKVTGFLDLAGAWDPSLALVMLGAVAAALLPMTWAKRRARSLLDQPMQLPQARALDRRLIVGNLVFGVGWGLAGICPGPALTILFAGHWQAWAFFTAMVAGMLIFEALDRRRTQGA
ncbi:DUF6691 family protein [Stutzerimonas tarimensis]|uniref:DUF6691 family protein n=1 Tax=Stutzerimonas tarimensis TaxID=1507735 RepID=A0ABV7T5L3_9GAMM